MIDKLKKENTNLNNMLTKFKSEKNDNFGLSFIDNNNDLESSKFLDDKCFEDILSDLDKKDGERNDKKVESSIVSERNQNKKYNNNNSKDKKIDNNKDKSNINKTREGLFNTYLKDSINLLMNQVPMNQNAKSTLSSILLQLGCSDEDIYKLMGNYRGTISIASAASYLNKKI